MFLPCVNKGDDNDDDDDDDDDDDEGAGGRKKFAKFCLQPHLHKALTTKRTKKNDISKQLSKQAIRQAKLREITKYLLTRFT